MAMLNNQRVLKSLICAVRLVASQHDQDVITSLAIEPSNWWWKLARPRDQATWNGDMGSNGPTKLGRMKDWIIRRSCKFCLNVFLEPQPKSRWSDDLLRSSAQKYWISSHRRWKIGGVEACENWNEEDGCILPLSAWTLSEAQQALD